MSQGNSVRQITANTIQGLQTFRNYLANSSFEGTGDGMRVTGWSAFNTTMTSGLPTGSLAFTSSLTPSLVTSSQLTGSYSLQLTGVFTAAGQGLISDVFTLDRKDLGKVLSIRMAYEVNTSANSVNFSGVLGSQTLGVYIYDVTASAWVQPQGFLGMNQSAGPASLTNCTFQSSSVSGQQYRMAIIFLQPTSSTFALTLDDLNCGPQLVTNGTPITDWVSYTPTFTGFGTVSTSSFQWARQGDSILIQGRFLTGSGTAVPVKISLPAGLTIDTTKISASGSNLIGQLGRNANAYPYFLITDAADFSNIYVSIPGSLSEATGSSFGTNELQSVFTKAIPIQGWSSNAQMSNDTDTRIVTCQVTTGPANLNVTAGATVVFPIATFDTHGAYSNGVYTVPVSGFYRVHACGISSAGAYFNLFKNGVFYNELIATFYVEVGGGIIMLKCNAGDTLTLVPSGSVTIAYSAGNYQAMLTFERVSGPSVIAASESVNASYYSAGTLNVTANAAVPFPTKAFDSHGAYNSATGIYTVPVSGVYEVTLTSMITGSAGAYLWLYKNGALYNQLVWSQGGSAVINGGTLMINCNAGDSLSIVSNITGNYIYNVGFYQPQLSFKRLK